MKDFLQVDVCISGKFQESRGEFRDKFFTIPQRGYLFDDEGFSAFNKKYSFDLSKFAEAIREDDELVESLLDSLKEVFVLQDKTNEELADYVDMIDKDHQYYNALQDIINGHVFKVNEGKKLLLEYQDQLKSQEELSFNNFLKKKLAGISQFKKDYPAMGANVDSSISSGTSIDNLVIVGNIFHNPENFQISGETFVLDNAKEDVFGYSAFLIEDEHSYDIGSMEDRSEMFEKGDFSGCTFLNIEFIGCDFSDVSFRDCIFDSVGFEVTTMKNADLRGAKLTNTVFDGYRGGKGDVDGADYLLGMKINFADLAFAQKLGVLQISDSNKIFDLDSEKEKLNVVFVKDHEIRYKESLKKLVENVSNLYPIQKIQSSLVGGLFSAISGGLSSLISGEKSIMNPIN